MIAAVSNPQDAARLKAEASTWLGTPYCGSGAVKGAGSSCLLPWEILHAYGHLSPRPPGRNNLPKTALLDFMRNWLNSLPDFFSKIPPACVVAGDVVLIDYGIGHLLLAIDNRSFIHCQPKYGVQIVNQQDPNITKRIVGAWRPVL